MTVEEFWEEYTSKYTVDIFDTTYDFFSKELPTEFVEEYDVGEIILETLGHNETAKELERVMKFIKLIQERHPELYMEYFQYLDEFLVDYYCFHKNEDEAIQAFSNFVKYPVQDYDKLFGTLKKLHYYQYDDSFDDIITSIYDEVDNSIGLMPTAASHLSFLKLYINLEKYFQETDTKKNFKRKEFAQSLIHYDIELSEETLVALENGLFNDELFENGFFNGCIQDKNDYMLTLQCSYLKYMRDRNFNFSLSGKFWNKMLEYWTKSNEHKREESDNYFRIKTKAFEKFLVDISGNFLIDNRSEMIATLWSSVYIYDFLLSVDLISQATYDNFQETVRILKGKVIAIFTSELWNNSFVHRWTKPDGVSENEFREEQKIFEKSYHFKPQDFSVLKDELKDELDSIGELAKYIIIAAEEDIELKRKLELQGYHVPLVKEKKTGRNDPCPCGSGIKYKKCCGK